MDRIGFHESTLGTPTPYQDPNAKPAGEPGAVPPGGALRPLGPANGPGPSYGMPPQQQGAVGGGLAYGVPAPAGAQPYGGAAASAGGYPNQNVPAAGGGYGGPPGGGGGGYGGPPAAVGGGYGGGAGGNGGPPGARPGPTAMGGGYGSGATGGGNWAGAAGGGYGSGAAGGGGGFGQPMPPQYGGGGAVVRNDAPARIVPIKTLNPFTGRWTIKARCTSKSELRRWNGVKGEGKLFSFDLLDTGGGEIRVTAFNDAVDKVRQRTCSGQATELWAGKRALDRQESSGQAKICSCTSCSPWLVCVRAASPTLSPATALACI
eukprot:352576-Chlamydomonas_euryale.AAC.1